MEPTSLLEGPLQGFRIRTPSPRRLGSFLALMKGVAEAGTPMTAGELLEAFLSGGLGGEILSLIVEREDGSPLSAETADDEVPSRLARAAILVYYVELANVSALLNGAPTEEPEEA